MTNEFSGVDKFAMGYLIFSAIWIFTALFAKPHLPEQLTDSWQYTAITIGPTIPILIGAAVLGLACSVMWMIEGIQEASQ